MRLLKAAGTILLLAVLAAAKATAVDTASKRLIFQVVLNDEQGNFKLGKADLPDDVKAKLDAFDKANRELIYEVVLNEDSGNFKFGHTDLPDEAKAKIDEMVQHLKTDPKNIYIEVEGHTDNIGPKTINEKIGLERAQAVQKYLYEQYQIPLHKINVISYGQEKPVAPNKTKDGRAQNRRVVIKVLA